jgi:predicted  nucleic acid-binding Zn-ribbon protein
MAARDNLTEMQALRAQGLSVKQIGARYGISDARVCKLIGKMKVKPRCTRCGEIFTATKASALYCPTCRTAMDQRQSNAANRKRMGDMERTTQTIPADDSDLKPRAPLPEPDPECYRVGLLKIAIMILGRTYEDITSDAKNITDEIRSDALDWWYSTAPDFYEDIGTTLPMPHLNSRTYQPELFA